MTREQGERLVKAVELLAEMVRDLHKDGKCYEDDFPKLRDALIDLRFELRDRTP